MFKWVLGGFFFLATMAVCSGANAGTGGVNLDFGLWGGYRVDDLDWNIAGNAGGASPDVLSELTWKDLEIHQLGADVKLNVGRPATSLFAHGRAMLQYGWITGGENRDSDFNGDGRTLEWSRSINDAGDGDVFDLGVGGGPGLHLLSGELTVIPLVGFSWHRQDLRIRDGFQALSEPTLAPTGSSPPPVGAISGLDSTYEGEWRGPWAGIDLAWRPLERFAISGCFEYHWADYEADGRWNLRSDLAQPESFSHEADGRGVVFAFGVDFNLTAEWTAGFDARYQDWKTEAGGDRVFFADGDVAVTRLNEVNWESSAWTLGVSRRF